jgi:hypothetical protein
MAYLNADILEGSLAVTGVVARMVGHIAASWPFGLETLCYSGIPLHRSIARRIVAGSAEPHDDDIAKDIPEDPIASTVQAQLGVNLYIEIPESGGELEGWHRRMSRNEYDVSRNADPGLSYGIRRSVIGACDWAVNPSLGDVIIFQNSELHAIRPSEGARTTWGFFLGYRGDQHSMLIWS